LKAILKHNRDEEKEHAAMVLEWIRRKDPGVLKAVERLSLHGKTYRRTVVRRAARRRFFRDASQARH